MPELHDARTWAGNHGTPDHVFADLVTSVREAFEVLAAIRYDQPWLRERRRRTDRF